MMYARALLSNRSDFFFRAQMGLTNFGQPYAFDATWATWFQKRATLPDDTFEAFKANFLTMSNFATGALCSSSTTPFCASGGCLYIIVLVI
jgi:hypothetical protein